MKIISADYMTMLISNSNNSRGADTCLFNGISFIVTLRSEQWQSSWVSNQWWSYWVTNQWSSGVTNQSVIFLVGY